MSTRRRRAGGAVLALVAVVGLAVAALVGLGVIRAGGAASGGVAGVPHFVEEAAAAGVVKTYDGAFPTFVGGGVATFDCNADGRPDLYIGGGAAPATLYRNDSPRGGALRFTAVPDAATDLPDVEGAYPLDIDGDGNPDLVVLQSTGVTLLRGLGDCRFEAANERWGFDPGKGLATAFSATWEGADALPTMAVGRYTVLDASGQSTQDCDTNVLIRPRPDGSGYAAATPLTPGFCALSMLFSDWDRSGRRDLRVSNDRQYYDPTKGQEQLWRVAPGQAPRLYTAADGWVTLQVEGMGIGSYDLTGDGYPEVYLTSQAANRLQALTNGPSQPTYGDIGLARGVNSAHPWTGDVNLPSTSWHPEFQDVNNDGLIDLFVTKGNVSAIPDFATKDATDLFLGRPDGTFVEAAGDAGILNLDKGRGAAVVDLNLDGLPDVVEVNHGAPVRLWRNVGAGTASQPAAMGSWIALALNQPGPNRNAIGSWVEVRVGDTVQRREITSGGGHASGELGWIHFGLGGADGADVRVQWPDGTVGPWQHVSANGFWTIDRSAAAPVPWTPPAG